MSHALKTSPHTTLGYCEDCKSEHLNPGCGMTYVQRLRSVKLDTSVTPTKTLQNYYDDDALTGLFGGKDASERHEQMMEETGGVQYANPGEIREHTDLAAAHYLDSGD